MRKFSTLLLTLILSAGALSAWDYHQIQIGDLYYNLDATTNTAEVTTNPNQYNGDIIIPSSVTYAEAIYSVTSVGDWAFANGWNLTSVTIPNSVTTLGMFVFYECPHLTSINIPSSVTSLNGSTFFVCPNLANIVVDSANPKYDSRNNCNAIIETATNKLIVGGINTIIPNSVTGIAYWAYGGRWSVDSVKVAADNPYLSSIDGVLYDKNLTKLILYPSGKGGKYVIPNGVTSIGNEAFGYSGISSLEIPNSLTSIGVSAFESCSLGKITCNAVTPPACEGDVFVNGAFFTGMDKSTCKLYVPEESINLYKAAEVWEDFINILPINCEGPELCLLGAGACGDSLTWTLSCDGILNISGKGEMTSNPWNDKNYAIKEVRISKGVTSICSDAFYSCGGLDSVDIPNTIITIGMRAFWGCVSLENVVIPTSVTNIGGAAFCGCYKLTNIVIPNSVTSIGGSAFSSCTGLKSITLPNSLSYLNEGVFTGCSNLFSIEIPNSVTGIGKGVFSASGLKNVIIPNSVTSIGTEAFEYCGSLKSITIGSGVISIGSVALAGTGLTTIINNAVIPQTINNDVFGIYHALDKSACKLYVPAESLNLYKAANVWKDFLNILPIDEEQEDEIERHEGDYIVHYWDNSNTELCNDTVVLHVPVAPMINGFSFIGWQASGMLNEDGIILQAIYEAEEPTEVPAVYANPANPAQKLIRNGSVYILTEDKTYTITGQTVK